MSAFELRKPQNGEALEGPDAADLLEPVVLGQLCPYGGQDRKAAAAAAE